MTFIVTLITLVVERFFDWSHLRNFSWFATYESYLEKKLPGKNPYLVIVATILPIVILAEIILFLINGALYGFVRLIFEVIVLLYCYGPKNLWADGFASINTLTQGDGGSAKDKLKQTFGISEVSSPQKLHHQLLDHLFVAANRRVFAVVFWYVVAGIPGALVYRLITIATDGSSLTATAARKIEEIMDYVPVRIFSFLFALGGHFVNVLTCWRQKVLLGLSGNETLLTDCGFAALGANESNQLPDDGSIERDAVGLLDRVFIIALVLVAMVVLAS